MAALCMSSRLRDQVALYCHLPSTSPPSGLPSDLVHQFCAPPNKSSGYGFRLSSCDRSPGAMASLDFLYRTFALVRGLPTRATPTPWLATRSISAAGTNTRAPTCTARISPAFINRRIVKTDTPRIGDAERTLSQRPEDCEAFLS